LPGEDGKTHSLVEYASSPVLVVVFTGNHCPIAQMYERRIQQVDLDYRNKGAAVVAIQPNDPHAIRIDELDSSDISDSLEEMKIPVEYKHLQYAYLYDGETQSVTRAYGPRATPHVFVFDQTRHLRYEGRFDNSYRTELVKTQDARNAVEALLAGKEVSVKHTGVFGCSTKWQEKQSSRIEALKKLDAKPVQLELTSADDLKKLRTNPTGKMTLVSFWATWCGSCVHEFADLEDTYRMYSVRDLRYVTVSTNMPDEKESILRMLKNMHSTSSNLLLASEDTVALQAAFDPKWESAVPYTVCWRRVERSYTRSWGRWTFWNYGGRFCKICHPTTSVLINIGQTNSLIPHCALTLTGDTQSRAQATDNQKNLNKPGEGR
jgi:thiol-disulfide isomerase/thioredoxin